LRIISGSLKSRRFSVPPGFPSRPTTNFAKEGLFNILQHSIDFNSLKVLDLCAGTGNLSFEFISRGAQSAVAVDENFTCAKFLKANAHNLGITSQFDVQRADCIKFLTNCHTNFDIIIADPPYEAKFHESIIQLVQEKKLLLPNGILIIEHGRHSDFSTITNFSFCRIFGNVYFSFFNA
jgi:16S rRNA (guanine966-N2)-methyltransferase